MAVITYKCPNCGGELIFDPASQKYKCEYCTSLFSQEELEAMTPKEGSETSDESNGSDADVQEAQEASAADKTQAADGTQSTGRQAADGGSKKGAVVYTCPSCGAQIVTDETTAATFCYYCHNPVVLSGRLSGEYLPDKVIPFAFDKKAATQKFMDYVSSKKFVPKAFFDQKQIEKLSGVYFPYWLYDCDIDGRLDGEGTKIRVWRAGDIEYTETSVYRIERQGDVHLEGMTKNALKKTDKALVEGVLPFRLKESKDFSMGYLSGFQAEKRDMEQDAFADMMHQDARDYTKRILHDTISGYTSVNVQPDAMNLKHENWNYLLLPVWVLTYAGKNGQMFYYAMNGQTGTIAGKLPLDYKKLGLLSGIIGAAVLLAGLLGGFLL